MLYQMKSKVGVGVRKILQEISIHIVDSTDEGQWSDPNSVEEVIEPETFTILEEPSSERIPLRRST